MRRMMSAAFVLSVSVGCNSISDDASQPTHVIAFAAQVGEEPFSCSKSFTIGSAGTTAEAYDFRFYVHDIKFVTKEGTEVPVALVQDGKWQYQNVALLDFANDEGVCDSGSPETNTAVRVIAPEGEYVGVHFNFGVPADKNHVDAATAPAPLNHPGLWWNWKGGYKYARIDLKTPKNDPYYFHMGGTECGEKEDGSYKCDLYNVPTVKLGDFNPLTDAVAFRLDKFYAGVDLDAAPNMTTDFTPGCMAFDGDVECEVVFNHLGLTFASAEPGPEQTVFEVAPIQGGAQ